MVEWKIEPEIFNLGFLSIRWYSLMFMITFLLGYYIVRQILIWEQKPVKYADQLFGITFFAMLIGARLGHCFFYDPHYFLTYPPEILYVWKGGLASHGAAISILIALYFFTRNKPDLTFTWLVDRMVIVVALAGFFVRMGNLFNSEIIGKPTGLPWAFVFVRVDNIPRHPVQLYEALAYLIIFILL